MPRGGRPRKPGVRRSNGRLKYDKTDKRYDTALTRCRAFGVTRRQSINPLSGYLAGVLFLRRVITEEDIGRYFSFLHLIPVHARAIQYGIRVSGGRGKQAFRFSRRYHQLTRKLGRDIDVLHSLTQDRLTCSVDRLRGILKRIPLCSRGSQMMTLCEAYRRGRDPAVIHERRDNTGQNREPLTEMVPLV